MKYEVEIKVYRDRRKLARLNTKAKVIYSIWKRKDKLKNFKKGKLKY